MKRRSLREEGMFCVTALVLGLSNSDFIPRNLRDILTPVMLVAIIATALIYYGGQSMHSEEELEREAKDERSRMIQEKASYYSRQAEDFILLGLFAVLGIGFRRFEIADAFLWFMIGRWWLSFVIRWWLNRKY